MGNLLKRLRGENPEPLIEDSGFTPYSWPTDSKATLCRVPWDAEYRNVVDWQDQQHKDSYFSSLKSDSCELGSMTYLKPNDPIFVDVPFSKAYSYNYVVVENPKLPVPGEVEPRKLYYFVTAVGYVAPNTTSIAVQLDVWTTYGDTAEFGRCFVERGHVAIAAEASADAGITKPQNLRRYLTAAEGLDIGNEYESSHLQKVLRGGVNWYVLITATVDLTADWGSAASPSLTAASGQVTDNVPEGTNTYAIYASDLPDFMGELKGYPWIGKGIVSLQIFSDTVLKVDGEFTLQGGVTAFKTLSTPDDSSVAYVEDIYGLISQGVPYKYRNLKKLLCYPYSVIELNSYNGSPLVLKPELLNYNDHSKGFDYAEDRSKPVGLDLHSMACAAPGHTKCGVYPWNYAAKCSDDGSVTAHLEKEHELDGSVTETIVPNGGYIDNAVWFEDFPKLTIVNDEYAFYLASTQHTRQWSYDSAGWQQAKSNASASLSYDQVQQQIATNRANWNASTQGLLGNVAGNLGNLAMSGANALGIGAEAGGAADFANGVLGTVAGAIGATGWDNMQDIVNNLTGLTALNNTQAMQGNIASQNLDLAQWAAQGDYENAIAKINATVQDAAVTTPSTSGTVGGSGFNFSNRISGVWLKVKGIDRNHMHVIGEYWLRYGYAVREFMVPPADLCCMEHFTYWKMLETSVECALADETSKETIRGIFEKGVTVWKSADEITTWDLSDNDPVLGEYY